ncbi:trypsin-like peptidase domain-containing protein [Actinoplanes sp. NPDC049118]|uniref:trypsin-like peptidase domain-containing protein n=1 Tax=Actinoplanes sp. NPDC049118 TaxID=3155769 RepID=UPI0034030457
MVIEQVDDRRFTGPGYDPWTVTVFAGAARTPLGCGVLIDRRRVLTCWHVVEGQDTITVAFPKAGVPRTVRVEVAETRGDRDLDVAVLQLATDAPPEAAPAPLRSPRPQDLAGDRWWAFGFPRESEFGADAHGQIGIALAYGRVRLDTRSRYVVKAGFSGTGVWSRDFHAVVGLVVQARQGGRNAGDAEALTLSQIARELPGENLQALAAWSIAAAGDTALEAWGWSLSTDLEAVRHWRPRARGVSIDTEGGYRFRGRTVALAGIVDWLRRTVPDTRVLVLTGSPGVGKSAVLGRIVTTADEGVRAALPEDDRNVRAPVGSVACAVHMKGKTALDVAVEIARAASVRMPRTVDDLVPVLRDRLSRTRGRFNLVVDALDEAASPAQARLIVSALLLPIARTCAPFGAQVIVGSRRVDDRGSLLRAFGKSAYLIDLDRQEYFAEADLEAYALATLALLGAERAGNPYAESAVAQPVARRIATLADRNFLIAGLIARSHGMYDEEAIEPDSLSFTATVDEALAEYLNGLHPIDGVPATDLLIALAYAHPPGMSIDLWRVALEALDVRISREALLSFAGSSAANFLVESSRDAGTPRYRLFHQALNDSLVKKRTLHDRRGADELALARHLIGYGRQAGWAQADPYLLRTLPTYAARAGMIDELLADDAFLLHADLPRLTQLAEHALTPGGRARARLLRLTSHALNASPAERAALFGVTSALEQQPNTFAAWPEAPYRVGWAAVPSRAEHSILESHTGAVRAICAVTVDRRSHIASVGDFPHVRLWDPATGQHWVVPIRTGEPGRQKQAGPLFAACSVTGGGRTLLAAAGKSGQIYFIDPTNRRLEGTFAGPSTAIRSLCTVIIERRTHLVAGCDDGMIRIWELRTGGQVRVIPAHNGPVRTVSVVDYARGPAVLSAGDDYLARVWDPSDGGIISQFGGHVDRVRAACSLTVGGRVSIATTNFTNVLIHNRGALASTVGSNGHSKAILSMAACRVNGRTALATVSSDGDVRVWDPRGGGCLRVLAGHTDVIHAVCTVVLDGNEYLATGGRDRTIRLWDLTADEGRSAAARRGGRTSAACTIRLGTDTVAGVDGTSGVIRLQAAETGAEIRLMGGGLGTVNSLCAVRVGSRELVVVASDFGVIQSWEPGTGKQILTDIRRFEHLQAVCAFRGEDGEDLLAIAGTHNHRVSLRFCRPDNGRIVQRQRLTDRLNFGESVDDVERIHAMRQISGVQPMLATAGDNDVIVWGSTGRYLGRLRGHGHTVRALTEITADGRRMLASAGDDRTIRIWDLQSGTCTAVLTGHLDGVNALCPVTVGGRPLLASGGKDRTIRIWEPTGGSPILSIPVHYPVLACLEVSNLLFAGLTAGSVALNLNARHQALPNFWER